MKFHQVAAAFMFAAGLTAPSSLGAQELKKQLEEVIRPVIERPDIDPARLRPSFDSGATHWIAPMLKNAPGTISGEPFTINGKRLSESFDLSVINPNAEKDVTVWIGCFDAGGAYLSRYATSFVTPRSGATNWKSSSVTPPATSDGAHQDVDEIWCAVAGEDPIVVFGWTEIKFGSDTSRYHFSLERVAPKNQ